MDLDAVTSGDLRKQLVAVRDVLAERMGPELRADAVGPIGRLYVDVCVKLDELPNDAEGSVTDALGDELAQRRVKPAGPPPATRRKKAAAP